MTSITEYVFNIGKIKEVLDLATYHMLTWKCVLYWALKIKYTSGIGNNSLIYQKNTVKQVKKWNRMT